MKKSKQTLTELYESAYLGRRILKEADAYNKGAGKIRDDISLNPEKGTRRVLTFTSRGGGEYTTQTDEMYLSDAITRAIKNGPSRLSKTGEIVNISIEAWVDDDYDDYDDEAADRREMEATRDQERRMGGGISNASGEY
jgi:hypothetical protein